MDSQAKLDELEMLQSMYPDTVTVDMQDYTTCLEAPSSLRYSVTLERAVFEVMLPVQYPDNVPPEIRIRVEDHDRETQSTVQQTMADIIAREWSEGECVVLQCITQALELIEQAQETSPTVTTAVEPATVEDEEVIRMWYYAHHIYSKTKRSSMLQWSKEYCLTGFILPGKPGIICIEGLSKNCKEFNSLVRAMNWQLLKLQHEELHLKQGHFEGFRELIFDVHGHKGTHQDLGQFKDYLESVGLDEVFQILFKIGK